MQFNQPRRPQVKAILGYEIRTRHTLEVDTPTREMTYENVKAALIAAGIPEAEHGNVKPMSFDPMPDVGLRVWLKGETDSRNLGYGFYAGNVDVFVAADHQGEPIHIVENEADLPRLSTLPAGSTLQMAKDVMKFTTSHGATFYSLNTEWDAASPDPEPAQGLTAEQAATAASTSELVNVFEGVPGVTIAGEPLPDVPPLPEVPAIQEIAESAS